MKIKVSDFIADYLESVGIRDIFTVVGGGAMHLNDSFGHHSRLRCTYFHHEQAAAIAAEGYAKVCDKPACVCVTSGPGAVNALNGVVGAYQDSIPMLVISGQTKSTLTTRYNGLNLRSLGNQEFDILSAITNMVKYAKMLTDPRQVRYEIEKAIYISKSERPGPVWIDIPLDIQGAYVNEEEMRPYSFDEIEKGSRSDLSEECIKNIHECLMKSKRPVLYAGNGIRIAGAVEIFHRLVDVLNIPVVTCWDSIDMIETENPLYVGRGGTMGDRAGNFAVQNSDFLLCIGSRLNIYQVGYDIKTWAREAYVVDVDIDPSELEKPTIRVDLPICADAKEFIECLFCYATENKVEYDTVSNREGWNEQCSQWKDRYPVIQKKHQNQRGNTNIYAFMDRLSHMAGKDSITVVANGSASVVGSQAYYIDKGQRFIMNCGLSSMGYDLPASIGASIGAGKGKIICIAGDGSIQMNIQELQTIVTNNLPIHIFVINNGGYHQIRLTQKNVFKNGFVGIGPESKDLGFPEMEKIAYAYNIPYYRISCNEELNEVITEVLEYDGFCICEVICDHEQVFEPKSATKKKEDGTLVSPPLEDMAPFMSREELRENMIIPLMEG